MIVALLRSITCKRVCKTDCITGAPEDAPAGVHVIDTLAKETYGTARAQGGDS